MSEDKKKREKQTLKLWRKYDTLVWYARKNPEKILENSPREIYEGMMKGLERCEKKYPRECKSLNDPERSDWTHGFNTGMLAALTLIMDKNLNMDLDNVWL
tara:strand:+ start:1197 stop:1499 length:303 start_codon:yes stop_codon:yes gene_type:complete